MKIEKILKEAVSVLLNEYDKQQEEIKRYKIIIEKQQKEIQKLEARKYMFNAETGEITQIPIDNNYINKNKIKEKTADEMFEELGYKKQYENESIYYYMDIDLKDNYIVFETGYKSFAKISCYHDAGDITMQELQAINKKCKELRLDIMNKCKYLTIRSKNYEKHFYCRLNKKIINYTTECVKCVKNEPRRNKGINKKTSKQIKLEKSRYSIITDDLTHCIECGRTNVELHEVWFGANRKLSIEDGLVIPLCKQFHHNGNLIGIHCDYNLNLKYKKIAEEKWIEHYGRTKEDFIKRYGRSVL